jgi:hypothetical protein
MLGALLGGSISSAEEVQQFELHTRSKIDTLYSPKRTLENYGGYY